MIRTATAPVAFTAITLALAACGDAVPASTEPAAEDLDVSEAIEPVPENPEEDIRHFLAQEYPEAEDIRYALAWRDLHDDGIDEAIVYVVSPSICGTGGCNTLVLAQAGAMWSKVGDISVSRTPISVLDSETNGWHDLTLAISGGGGPSGNVRLEFDGEAYPSNASTAPPETAEAEGTELIADQPELQEVAALD